ncbi:MAG: SDR family oxidoreductase [Myxococcales bacterium]|nr:SDR family oxidoreductase [Myxococcales bacterium]
MYLITGATGFVGKHLIDALVEREGTIYCLVRPGSRARFDAMVAARWPAARDRFQVVEGDIQQARCGVSDAKVGELRSKVSHVVHLAALYDMRADADASERANVQGTRHACALAEALDARLDYVSSIAVAGNYKGYFREDMFDEGQTFSHPYLQTKFLAERVVRTECKAPYRIYRPGIVIGSSKTGEADKVDGVYYAFKSIQRLRHLLPEWTPLLGFEGSELPIVPVDFVARAMDVLMHADGLDGQAFHLVDPHPKTFGDAMNVFCEAAHAPQGTIRLDPRVLRLVPTGLTSLLGNMPAVKSARRELLDELGVPEAALRYVNWRASFDSRDTEHALRGSGVECPRLEDYAWRVWDYWERHLDPDLYKVHTLRARVEGKVVMVTGASSGIGKALARKLGDAGATVLLVARGRDKLEEVHQAILAAGGRAEICPCDLSSAEDCARLVEETLSAHEGLDILVNNAGRSIRRGVRDSYDRFHDFERTMALNYFGSLRLILGFLPSMCSRKTGHIVNVSSIGVQTNAPRFSAYVASKSALDAFSRCIASEVIGRGVHISTVYMPLVRTPMIAPTKIYDAFPTITPDQAADMVIDGILTRRKRVATRLGIFGEVSYALAPRIVDRVLHTGYRLMPDSAKKKGPGGTEEPPRPSMEAIAFAHVLKGVHW